MTPLPSAEICARIAKVRIEAFGPRGKSTFCKKLGLSPSTYDYYERDRVPPAPLLVKIAAETQVDLLWLLTGKTSSAPGRMRGVHPVIARAAELLAQTSAAVAPLAAFLDLLEKSLGLPAHGLAASANKSPASPVRAAASRRVKSDVLPPAPAGETPWPVEQWIPVLGRSAAGVPQFWSETDSRAGVTGLEQIIARHAQNADRKTRPALAEESDRTEADPAQIIAVSESQGPAAEFIAARTLKARHPDAFALRIDGDSMAPDIRHGDLVILSPSCPAVDGRYAVVQLQGQIGVTCKLFRCTGKTVHLIAINEQIPPQRYPAPKLAWALQVLARVRG